MVCETLVQFSTRRPVGLYTSGNQSQGPFQALPARSEIALQSHLDCSLSLTLSSIAVAVVLDRRTILEPP